MEINDLLDIAISYRQKVPETLTQTSAELVEQEMLKLEEYDNVMQEADAKLADEIDVLRGKRRAIQLAQEFMHTDLKKLKSRFWAIKNAEKEMKYRSPNAQ